MCNACAVHDLLLVLACNIVMLGLTLLYIALYAPKTYQWVNTENHVHATLLFCWNCAVTQVVPLLPILSCTFSCSISWQLLTLQHLVGLSHANYCSYSPLLWKGYYINTFFWYYTPLYTLWTKFSSSSRNTSTQHIAITVSGRMSRAYICLTILQLSILAR